ncbi:MAG TPA: hypothetical protein VJ583_03315 [Nitrososphaeraceae archaeon]|nr:hypothetical protein [Nitrososphaeraceae archaeon]
MGSAKSGFLGEVQVTFFKDLQRISKLGFWARWKFRRMDEMKNFRRN